MLDAVKQVVAWLFTDSAFQEFYARELRSDFFNGFLSLAAFMLAAKTFIVMHMKQEVYDRDSYGKRFKQRKELAGEAAATRYGPLERMSKALYWIVISSVIAAMSQITLGLWAVNFAALLCILLVAFAVWKLIQGLLLIKTNLDSWFEMLREEEGEEDARNQEPESKG